MDLQIKVAQAVHLLNHDTQSCNRVAANQWLVQFQQSDAAWQVATSILTSDHHQPFASDFEVEFFAAQILKRKVSLPSSSPHSLTLLFPFLPCCVYNVCVYVLASRSHCALLLIHQICFLPLFPYFLPYIHMFVFYCVICFKLCWTLGIIKYLLVILSATILFL